METSKNFIDLLKPPRIDGKKSGRPRRDGTEKKAVRFDGRWRSGTSAELELSITGSSVLGKYRTQVGREGFEEEFSVAGFVSGDRICFSVDWGRYAAVASSVGQYKAAERGNIERIVTTWLLCESMTGAVANHVSSGTDTFQRVEVQ
ncbi:avidin/streptavidin family protein [Caballeronia sp. LP006]|uniref:avidin/streptavidin family protein n=1 Tax=Caballeronia sp. LP006 TaxID=3038552 RepID=UPI0028570A47|nr:avidin/streptavidin family protein [Caballeronia sp. LP006]MDR5832339.1 avidin/streptavidin family protein [Caballeronia sp. LP006]